MPFILLVMSEKEYTYIYLFWATVQHGGFILVVGNTSEKNYGIESRAENRLEINSVHSDVLNELQIERVK